MKKLITSNIVTPVKQPLTKASLDLIQASYKETFDSLLRHKVFGSSRGQYVIVDGVVATNTGFGVWDITSGFIYANISDNQPLYYDGAVGVVVGVGEVLVCYKATTYDSNDPILLSDGNTANVHQNNVLIIEAGVTGSGGNATPGYTYLCDYSSLIQECTIKQVYTDAAVSGSTTQIPIVLSGTSVYTPDEVLVSKIDQFNKFEYHGIFRVTNGSTPSAGWNLLTVIPEDAMPANITENYYLSCVRYWGVTDVEITALLITPSRNMYYYNPSSAVVSEAHVNLYYSV